MEGRSEGVSGKCGRQEWRVMRDGAEKRVSLLCLRRVVDVAARGETDGNLSLSRGPGCGGAVATWGGNGA